MKILRLPAHAELPLTPARTVRFTTDEGTWMSLDISPNGQTLVFDLAGDLYTSTGSPRTFSATNMESRFSRDILPNMTFTPDSKSLIAAWNGKVRRVVVGGVSRSGGHRSRTSEPAGTEFHVGAAPLPRGLALLSRGRLCATPRLPATLQLTVRSKQQAGLTTIAARLCAPEAEGACCSPVASR